MKNLIIYLTYRQTPHLGLEPRTLRLEGVRAIQLR